MTNNGMTEKKRNRREFESELIAKAWKDEAFRQELLNNPKAVYARELGQQIPDHLEIRVLEEDSNALYLVLPKRPQVSEELSDEALETVAGGSGIAVVWDDGAYLVARW